MEGRGDVRSKFKDADENVWHLKGMIYDIRLQEAICSHFWPQFCLPMSLHPKDSCYLMDEVTLFSGICIISRALV